MKKDKEQKIREEQEEKVDEVDENVKEELSQEEVKELDGEEKNLRKKISKFTVDQLIDMYEEGFTCIDCADSMTYKDYMYNIMVTNLVETELNKRGIKIHSNNTIVFMKGKKIIRVFA